MTPDGFLHETGIEQWRQLARQHQLDGRAAGRSQAGRRDPLPRCAMPRRQMPPGRHMRDPAPRLRDDLLRDEQPKLDADTRETYTFSALLGARRNIVVTGKLSPLHASSIIDDGQRGIGGVGRQADTGRARVEPVGDDFRENRLLERTGICVAKVFEEMVEVDASFAHAGILSRHPDGSRLRRTRTVRSRHVPGC